ncbi:MAG: CHASE2 domain-containing protein [Chloroflexi bacterium]|nr:CHASE2 domain-containing protein [Chloroflexota bacterium]
MMKRLSGRLWTTKTRIGLLVAFATIILLLFSWANNFFAQSQLRLTDLFFVSHPVSDTVVIVALDDAAHNAYGRSLAAWSRTVYADLITFLNRAEARVVAFDVLFDQPTDDDAAVVEAIRQARQSDARTRFVMPKVGADQVNTQTPDTPALRFYNTIYPTQAFADAVDYVGYVNAFTDVDSVVRRQISLVENRGEIQLSFDLATYLAYLRIPPAAASQMIQPAADQLTVASINIPVDENGLWQQNYFGAPANANQQTFPVYSALDVINGKVTQGAFDDKIVLVGLMNTTAATDLYPVPSSANGQLMAGVEIHANAIESLLQDSIPSFQPRLEQVIMIVSLALVSSLIYAHLKWYWMLPAAALMTVMVILLASIRFSNNLQFINLFYGALAVIIPLGINLFADIALEIRRSTKAEFLLRSAIEVSSQRMAIDRILPSLAGDIQRVLMTNTGGIWLMGDT